MEVKWTHPRRITYISADGSIDQQFGCIAHHLNKREMTFDWSKRETVWLNPEDEGVRWARGWQTKAAKVLHIVAALT